MAQYVTYIILIFLSASACWQSGQNYSPRWALLLIMPRLLQVSTFHAALPLSFGCLFLLATAKVLLHNLLLKQSQNNLIVTVDEVWQPNCIL